LALPDPELLEIHASIANIMQKSGALWFIYYILRWKNFFPDLRALGDNEFQDLDHLALIFSVLDLNFHMTQVIVQ